MSIDADGLDYHPMEASTGSLFRIRYPDDWVDTDLYDFDWSVLRTQTDRFERFNFDEVPS